jgi:hypothetical protein
MDDARYLLRRIRNMGLLVSPSDVASPSDSRSEAATCERHLFVYVALCIPIHISLLLYFYPPPLPFAYYFLSLSMYLSISIFLSISLHTLSEQYHIVKVHIVVRANDLRYVSLFYNESHHYRKYTVLLFLCKRFYIFASCGQGDLEEMYGKVRDPVRGSPDSKELQPNNP